MPRGPSVSMSMRDAPDSPRPASPPAANATSTTWSSAASWNTTTTTAAAKIGNGNGNGKGGGVVVVGGGGGGGVVVPVGVRRSKSPSSPRHSVFRQTSHTSSMEDSEGRLQAPGSEEISGGDDILRSRVASRCIEDISALRLRLALEVDQLGEILEVWKSSTSVPSVFGFPPCQHSSSTLRQGSGSTLNLGGSEASPGLAPACAGAPGPTLMSSPHTQSPSMLERELVAANTAANAAASPMLSSNCESEASVHGAASMGGAQSKRKSWSIPQGAWDRLSSRNTRKVPMPSTMLELKSLTDKLALAGKVSSEDSLQQLALSPSSPRLNDLSAIEGSDSGNSTIRSSHRTSAVESNILDLEDKLAQEAAYRVAQMEDAKSKVSISRNRKCTLRAIVSSPGFEVAVSIAVFLNAILIGIDTETASTHPGEHSPIWVLAAQHFFSLAFTLELLMRVKAFGLYQLFVRNGLSWEWLDLVIVSCAIAEMVSDSLMLAGVEDVPSFIGVSQLRMARIVKVTRLIRTLRIQKIIRFVAPLRTLVFSIVVTLKSLLWAICLIGLIIYVVAVVLVESVTDFRAATAGKGGVTEAAEDLFISLPRAAMTLLQCISGGLNWRDAEVPLMSISPWSAVVFTIFICFVYFAVLNVVTGVFCSSAIETAQRTPEVIATSMVNVKNSYEKNLRELFAKLDRDGSGLITLAEMEIFLEDEVSNAQLGALEIDISDAWQLFRILDYERRGAIEIEKFVEGCTSVKGSAKGIDVAILRSEVKAVSRQLERLALFVEDPTRSVAASSRRLSPQTSRVNSRTWGWDAVGTNNNNNSMGGAGRSSPASPRRP